MFSLPFVVAAAFVTDSIDSDALDPDGDVFTAAEAFSSRVDVSTAAEVDDLLPRRRAAEVTVELRSGEQVCASTPNPVGDVDHFPMDYAAVAEKIERLIGEDAQTVAALVEGLPGTSDVVSLIDGMRLRPPWR